MSTRVRTQVTLYLITLSLIAIGCEMEELVDGTGGAESEAGAEVSAGAAAGTQDLCAPVDEGNMTRPSSDESPDELFEEPPPTCLSDGCPEGSLCVEVQRTDCPPRREVQRCECDPDTGDVTCEVETAEVPCVSYTDYECQEGEVPPGGVEPPLGGDEPPLGGDEPPPAGGETTACVGPNPAASCVTDGCPDGQLCLPGPTDECVPSTCECDEEVGEWLCTRDCLPRFECSEACSDADQDRLCDAEDTLCELDQVPLSCRMQAPECSPGTVPEVVGGCYTTRCVTWDECARLIGGTPPVEPISCGGFRPEPVECPEGMFCRYELEAMCGAADAPGLCHPILGELPCPDLYAPICGCDGQTYSNECEATQAGTSVSSLGECGSPPSEGGPGEACGSRGLPQCAEGLFCAYPPEAMCGVTDLPGACEPTPLEGTACPTIFQPVCGCDGVTYGNSCLALVAMTSVAYEGPCQEEQLQCGGIAAFMCPRDLVCVDDPSDDCDPERGGTDCMGVCVSP